MMDDYMLRRLSAGRWTIPLLAEIAAQDGARFAVLLVKLGIARDSLVRALSVVIGNGWVMRNPGHGHPLRPEYMLTEPGTPIAQACLRMMEVRRRLGLLPHALPHWSLPILGQLDQGWARFSDLRMALAPVTPRALSLNLQQMIGGDLVARRLEGGFPPSALYGLRPTGELLVRCAQSVLQES